MSNTQPTSQPSSERSINKRVVATSLTEDLYKYILDHNEEPEVLGQLRDVTNSHPGAPMQVAPDQARFMAWLVETMQAKKAVEVGVFTGYSSTVVAMALPDDGKLVAIDKDPECLKIAKEYWEKANVSHKIMVKLGDAQEMLEAALKEEGEGTFDFGFIDGPKDMYDQNYETMLQMMRVGGVIAIDNILWSGRVANKQVTDEITVLIRELNDKIFSDPRVSATMMHVGDGLTLCRKL